MHRDDRLGKRNEKCIGKGEEYRQRRVVYKIDWKGEAYSTGVVKQEGESEWVGE